MTPDRLPSPLRRMTWDGEQWVTLEASQSTVSDESRRKWFEWANGQQLQPNAVVAANTALELLSTGATAAAAAAAGFIAASRGTMEHVNLLKAEATWIESVVEDLKRQKADAPASLIARYQARHDAVDGAMRLYWSPTAQAAKQVASRPAGEIAQEAEAQRRRNEEARLTAEAQARIRVDEDLRQKRADQEWERRVANVPETAAPSAVTPIAPAPSRPARPPKPPSPPRPPRPSLQEFLSENSILVVSYMGAFLLFVATLLFELYTIKLAGELRFGGVLGLDLIFAAAGVGGLRSKRLRIVGQTYVAIFALLAPLVFVAAYVFLDLHAKGITMDLAFAVSGFACCVLYVALTLRLRVHAYGVLAMLALPVAWFGTADLLNLGVWRGPAFSLLPIVYTLVLFESPRLKVAGDRFSRFALPFVHASAGVALALTIYSLATSDTGWVRWVFASTALGLTVAYTAFRALGGARYGSALAQSALVLAASAAILDSSFGVWRATALSPLVVFFTVVQLRPPWLGPRAQRFAQDARIFVHISAAVVLMALLAELVRMVEWIPWAVAIALAAVAAGYALNRRLGGREPEAIAALASIGAAWTAGVHDIGLADWGAVAITPLLLVYAVAGRRAFSAYADYFVHAGALTAVIFLFLSSPGFVPRDWAIAATFGGLTVGYGAHRVLGAREPSGSFALASFVVTWVMVVDALGVSPWRGPALAPLAVILSVLASRKWRFIPASTQYFTHATLLVALGLVAVDMERAGTWMPAVGVAAAAPFGLAYLVDLTLRRREESAIIALVLLGTAWVCGADALHLGIWRGAAIAPLAVVYAVIESRGARFGPIGELLARYTRYLTHAATAAALAFAFGDMIAAGHWIVWTGSVTVAVITAAYLVSAVLGRSLDSALVAQVAFGAAWSLISTDLNLGEWRGPSLTALVAVYGLVTYRGKRLGPLGGLFARYGVYRAHAAAGLALIFTGYSVGAADAWLTGSITATFLGLAIAYGLICFIGGPLEMAVLALAAFGLAWAAASHDLRLGQWRPTAIALLPAMYAAITYRGQLLGDAGRKFARHGVLFIYAGGGLAFLVLFYVLLAAGVWLPWVAASMFGVLAASYLFAVWLGGGAELGLLFKTAFGLAWVAATFDLVPAAWWPASVAPLVALYTVAAYRGAMARRVGVTIGELAMPFVHIAAGTVVLLAVIETARAGAWLPWSVTVAAFAVSASYFLYSVLSGEVEGPISSMAVLVIGWAGLGQDLNLNSWRGTFLAALGLVFASTTFRGRRLGRAGALFADWSEWFVHAVAVLGLGWVVLDPSHFAASGPVAAVLGMIAVVYALYAWLSGRQPALLVTASAVTLSAVFEINALGLDLAYTSAALTVLAGIGAAVTHFTRDRFFRAGLYVLLVLQLASVATLNPAEHLTEAASLLVATAIVAWVARDSKVSAWLLFTCALFAVDWYWLAQSLPRPPSLTDGSWVAVYGPLPLVFGLVALGLRSLGGRGWAWPLYGFAGAGTVVVSIGALLYGYFELAGALILAYSALLYATSAVEKFWEGAVAAGLSTAFGFWLLLYAAQAAMEWYPAATFGTSALLYALQVPWEVRFARTSDWVQSHRLTGLGGAAISALSSFAFFGLLKPHDWGALAAAAGLIGFGALVIVDGRRHGRPELDYLGAVLMSLAGLWFAFYLGAQSLEWYVILPGAFIVASGVRLPYDDRVRLPNLRLIARILTGAGMFLILGTSAVLTVLEPPNAWLYTSALVVEGVVAVLAGIGFKNRVLLIGGSAGIGISALRAIFVGLTQGWLPVWVVFFVVSIILLGLGAALALMRDRLPQARTRFGETWRDWN
jgi:hypothetical protein